MTQTEYKNFTESMKTIFDDGALDGTEKQVRWANDLRWKFYREADDTVCAMHRQGEDRQGECGDNTAAFMAWALRVAAEKSAHKWIELYNNAYRFGVEDAWDAIEAGVTPAMPW